MLHLKSDKGTVVAHSVALASKGPVPASATVAVVHTLEDLFRPRYLVVRSPGFDVEQLVLGNVSLVGSPPPDTRARPRSDLGKPRERPEALPIPSERWTGPSGPRLVDVTGQPGMSITIRVRNRSGSALAFDAELVGEAVVVEEDVDGQLAALEQRIAIAESDLAQLIAARNDVRARLERDDPTRPTS